MTTRRAAVIVIIVTLAVLWPLVRGEFTTWDDPHNVIANPFVLHPTFDSLKFHWTRQAGDLYIPITYTVWIALGAIARVPGVSAGAGGLASLNPWFFHGANLLAHLISALLVLKILRRLKFDPITACGGAIVFAIHPVQVESVGWISGLKDVLAGMFCLLAIDQYILLNRRRFVIALIAFVLAMLSKPSAVALPVILVIIDAMILRRSRRDIIRWTMPFFVLAIPFVALGRHFQPAPLVQFVPLWQRPLIALDTIAFYFWKIIWPAHLCIDYGRTPQLVISSHLAYFTWIAPAIVTIGLIAAYRRGSRLPLAAECIFVAAILPVLGFFPFEFQQHSTAGDHYLYLAMFAVALASASIAQHRAARPIAIIVIVALAIRSFAQTKYWHDSQSLYHHAIEVNPHSAAALNNLYVLAMDAQDGRQAEDVARRLAALRPDDPAAQLNVAAALAMQNRFDDAADAYRAAVQRWPGNVDAHLGLAMALTDAGHAREALAEYDAVERLDANHPNLAMLRAKAQRALDAVPVTRP